MERIYTSKYGKIVKRCPGLPEYWHKGEMIARRSSITSADPDERPTQKDWEFCVLVREIVMNAEEVTR